MGSPAATPDEHSQYRQIVGALIYLSVLTRPDITEAVSRLCRFMHAPTAAHLQDALFLLHYPKGTPEFGVTFVAQPGTLSLIGHSDSTFTTPSSAGKSVSGYVFSLAAKPSATAVSCSLLLQSRLLKLSMSLLVSPLLRPFTFVNR